MTETPSRGTHSGPIINSPYEAPHHHWQLDSRFRATNLLLSGRRASGAYLSVPTSRTAPARRTSALEVEPHPRINAIRSEVSGWREGGYQGASRISRELLEFWAGMEIEPRPFHCQLEALETIIWLTEAGPSTRAEGWQALRDEMEDLNGTWNEGIPRLALKMATGTGKTMVMAMIVVWTAFVRRSRTDIVLICPNLTVRERLGTLDPTSEEGADLYRSLTPPHRAFPAGNVHVSVLNFQAFQRRDLLAVAGSKDKATGATRAILRPHGTGADERWTEDGDRMLHRLLSAHRGAKDIVVLNDEAHHCYRPAPQAVKARKATKETKEYEEQASLWFNALRVLRGQGRLSAVFDLSATPMYLRRPADLPHDLFPWTVYDYPLIDAVEAGLTKIPRVPVRDDTEEDTPIYRDTYNQLKGLDRHPKRDRVAAQVARLLSSMHDDYRELDRKYAQAGIVPVMIVVANNKANAEGLYQYIAGYWQKETGAWVDGAYEMFSNVANGAPVGQPPALLVHSGIEDAVSQRAGANEAAALQKAFFSAGPGATKAEDAAHIRRCFNTVGVKREPGEHIRCIVAVSMLSEGWDVRTVTHIFGFRPFTSDLLCEQVAGRALRRTSFPSPGTDLDAEYARIFGVPFSFMRGAEDTTPPPPPLRWTVETVPNRRDRRIAFPNIAAYRIEPPQPRCVFRAERVKAFETRRPRTPTRTHAEGVVGEGQEIVHERAGETHVVYAIAREAVQIFVEQASDAAGMFRQRALFASMVEAVRAWLRHPAVKCEDTAHLLREPNVGLVPREVVAACDLDDGERRIHPVFMDEVDPRQPRAVDTSAVRFETSLKHRYPAVASINARCSELNAAACHSRGEAKLASALNLHGRVDAWARNFRLGWRIPYLDTRSGAWRYYEPDFVARLRGAEGDTSEYLVIEFKGNPDEDAAIKRQEVEEWWIPAVNESDDPACAGNWRYVFIDGEREIMPVLNRVTATQ